MSKRIQKYAFNANAFLINKTLEDVLTRIRIIIAKVLSSASLYCGKRSMTNVSSR